MNNKKHYKDVVSSLIIAAGLLAISAPSYSESMSERSGERQEKRDVKQESRDTARDLKHDWGDDSFKLIKMGPI